MVGISRAGLAAVLQTFTGGALRAAPHRPRPPAPAYDGLPERHRSWRTTLVCREKPRRPLQTHRTSTFHFRPLHRGHEDSYRRLHAGSGPCSPGQKSEWAATGIHAQMMNANKLVHEEGGFFSAGWDERIHWKKKKVPGNSQLTHTSCGLLVVYALFPYDHVAWINGNNLLTLNPTVELLIMISLLQFNYISFLSCF